MKRYEADSKRIVFEITEREKVKDKDVFLEAIAHYRGQDYQIAVDDLGSEYSNVGRVCRGDTCRRLEEMGRRFISLWYLRQL